MQYDENAEKYGYEGEMTPLKCDKLNAYKGDVTIPVYGTIADADVYLKSEADKVIARHKYKRCLAMVKYCDMGLTCYNEKLDSFSCERADFFYRWYNRWWKLAERLKEAK